MRYGSEAKLGTVTYGGGLCLYGPASDRYGPGGGVVCCSVRAQQCAMWCCSPSERPTLCVVSVSAVSCPCFLPLARGLAAVPRKRFMRTSELLVLWSVPPIPQRHAAVACVRGSGWAELNAALQSEEFMGVIGAAGLNRRTPAHSLSPSPKP